MLLLLIWYQIIKNSNWVNKTWTFNTSHEQGKTLKAQADCIIDTFLKTVLEKE